MERYEKSCIWEADEVTIDGVQESVERWEEMLDYVEEQLDYQMQDGDTVPALMPIIPAALKAKLLEEHGRVSTPATMSCERK